MCIILMNRLLKIKVKRIAITKLKYFKKIQRSCRYCHYQSTQDELFTSSDK